MGRIAIWLTGFLLLSLIYAAAIYFRLDTIEYDLRDRASLALIKNNFEWAKVAVDGRDVMLDGMAPDEASRLNAEQAILAVWGVRAVKNRSVVTTFTDKVIQSPLLAMEQSPIRQLPEQQELKKTPPVVKSDTNQIQIEAVAQCQQNIDEMLMVNIIAFDTGSSSLSPESHDLLDSLINILKACPESQIEVAGHTDNVGDPDKNIALSHDRAQAVLDYLLAAGVKGSRLSAVGYGATAPIESNDTEEGRKHNRRIELRIK